MAANATSTQSNTTSQPRMSRLVWLFLFLLVIAGAIAIGYFYTNQNGPPHEFRTWLLVEAPTGPLPANQPLEVRSRTEAPETGVSHVELYAIELPADDTGTQFEEVLISSVAAPFDQTIFTASQRFVPKKPGSYMIKVMGYNKAGEIRESEYIRFTVE